MHRFEMNGHHQFVALWDIVAIDPSDDGKWCFLHFRGGSRMSVLATSDEVFALIEENMRARGVRWAGQTVAQ
jgi:hypothetical protein